MSQITRPTILLVDSDPESLFNVAAILVAQQHRVITSKNSNAAILMAKQEPLDLLITETRLGDTTGEQLIKVIRMQPSNSDLPVMFVSAGQSTDVIRRTNSSGSAFHLRKPIDQQVLIELVDKALWMPHLVKNHIDQKTVKEPHVSFAQNPLASPFSTNAIFPGTPISQ